MYRYRDQKKIKGGTRRGRGQENRLSPPRSCPLPHHTDDDQQHHSATQQPAAAHTTVPRARAQGPKCRIHTRRVHERWCQCHRGSSHGQNKQTEITRKRESTKRGVGKRGVRPQKPRSRAAAKGSVRFDVYKLLFHFEAFIVYESIILLSPPPTCIARTIAILLHVHCAIYDAPPKPFVYAIHHTILAMAISIV